MWLRLIAIAVALAPAAAKADVVWPALYLVIRLFTWWAVAAGLVVEYLVYRAAFSLPPRKAAIADVSANAASVLLGVVAIPILGLIWEFGPGQLVNRLLDYGTFNPVAWAATTVIAALLNAAIEGFVLKRWFGVAFSRRTFLILTLANAVTVAIAFGSMFVVPVET